jgi:holo-[acyl-carrier protein] synthase
MIVGIGSDITDIRRLEKTIERFGERFIRRVFTDIEQAKSERRRNRVATYAKRWAAKEACSKALGTGLRMGVAWREMGVVNLRSGQPTMLLSGGAAQRLRRLIPEGMHARIHVTLTDDHPYAQAFVVIEALSPAQIPPHEAGRR